MNKKFLSTIKFFSLALLAVTFTACTDVEFANNKQGSPLQLEVKTAGIKSRGLIESTTLPDGHSVGLTLVDAGGSTYDNINYQNIQATASIGATPQTWALASDMLLSSTSGTLYGYYPHSGTVDDITQIPVTAGDTDYMYATPVTGLNDGNYNATVTMNHALAAIRLNIVRGTYTGTGEVAAVSVCGDNIATAGTLNARTGGLTGLSGAGTAITNSTAFTLSTTAEKRDFIFVPVGATSAVPTIIMTVDGMEYIATPNALTVEQGRAYIYNLEMNGRLDVTSSSVAEWDVDQSKELDMRSSYFTAIYDVTDISTATQLMGAQFNISQVHRMFIDGVEVTPVASYTFSTTGEHTVKCTFKQGSLISCKRMFHSCVDLITIDVTNLDTSEVTTMSGMFQGCSNLITLDVSKWNTSKVTTMDGMFWNCIGLTTLDVKNWDVSKVTNMEFTFGTKYIMSLSSLDISKWNTSEVTTMSGMFQGCGNLTTLDVSKWNTSKVTNMAYLFFNCIGLTTLDVENWDTSNVTNMLGMFGAKDEYRMSLSSLDISKWNTSEVTTMSGMFQGCSNLTTLDVSKWNTSKVTNMAWLFWKCEKLTAIDVSSWDFSSVTNTQEMFINCTGLTEIEINSNVAGITNCTGMFSGITTTGTFKYNPTYDYSNIIAVLPSTWTAVANN